MKKLLSFVLVLVMLLILSVSAIPVSAAEGPFKIGDVYYSTLKDAWTAATSSSKSEVTIYVVDDYDVATTEYGYDLVAGKTVNLIGLEKAEGGKPTITEDSGNVSAALFDGIKGTFYIKDVDITASRFAEAQVAAHIKLENVTGVIPAASETESGTKSDGPFIKCWYATATDDTVTIDIDNSYIESRSTVRPWIIASGSGKKKQTNVNITNSTLCAKGVSITSNYDSGVLTVYSASCTMNVNMVNSIVSNETTGQTASCIYTYNASSVVNVTADSTSVISSTGAASGNPIIDGKGTETLKLAKGAKLITGKEAALPVSTDKADRTDLGYVSGDKIYKEGATALAGTYTFVDYSADDFKMRTGAGIRTSAPVGIRFGVDVSESFLDTVGNFATFGALALPETLRAGAELTVDTDKVANARVESFDNVKYDEGIYTYYLALVGMDATAEAVNVSYAARGYMTIEYANAAAETFYTDFNSADNVRSMYQTAALAKEAGYGGAIIDQIIELGGNS